ncbi:tRNA glutamyl-Q(34) synthetase GluQRS [Alteromonas aestuariivivens]|uniref:Glutamyl-Q tRNA(Asp) synthetase n=1 Tax=Alteromonas aestuariivivens TaxID=1938339 RepID=A0A3D8M3U2_9ALTE|nr:tRNA glutamyl-Q(34) synthetase GluQRS [Alteromonas aestuariivivens]RDV24204.1 tRNA glutamyl-Q(34) synthetase GluQRS [Alteromonas aestuariivivens]
MNPAPYIGRFAPSPSGPLHFGSLIAALASYLDARSQNGRWLVRMEDIDEPRCIPGADQLILKALEAHGLGWDGEVVYQSQRHTLYADTVDALLASQDAYYCTCTRKQIKAQGGAYPGTCRDAGHGPQNAAIRLRVKTPITRFEDAIRGLVTINDPHALEDTIIKRRDGLFAYNLVVVLDDIAQGVNHIVRGSDLLSTTAAHLSLYHRLSEKPPKYAHIPVAATTPGRKLSKQNRAKALDLNRVEANMRQALAFLNMVPPWPDKEDTLSGLLAWARSQWEYKTLPQCGEIIVAERDSPYHNGL